MGGHKYRNINKYRHINGHKYRHIYRHKYRHIDGTNTALLIEDSYNGLIEVC